MTPECVDGLHIKRGTSEKEKKNTINTIIITIKQLLHHLTDALTAEVEAELLMTHKQIISSRDYM